MFKVKNININLDRKNGFYHLGETVSGSLDFIVTELVHAHSIKIILDGHTTHTYYNNKTNDRVDNYIPLVKCFINFLSPKEYGNEIKLEPGDYTYKFEFKLPENLPPSLRHKLGAETCYLLRAVFDLARSIDKTVERPIYILTAIDLSEKASVYILPKQNSETKVYGFLNKNNFVMATIKTPRWGFTMGEDIPFQVDVDNKSTRTIKSLRVELLQKIAYNNPRDKKTFLKILTTKNLKVNIEPRTTFKWDNEKLSVPLVIVQPENSNFYVDVAYQIRLTVFSTFFTIRFNVIMNIAIGSKSIDSQPAYEIDKLDDSFIKNVICF